MAAMLNAPYSQRRSVLKMYPIRHDTHNRPARMNAVRTTQLIAISEADAKNG